MTTDFGTLTLRDIYLRGGKFALMLCLYFGLAWVIGILAATPVFLLTYMLLGRERPGLALALAGGIGLAFFLIFDTILNLPWPVPLWDGAAWLREIVGSVRMSVRGAFTS